MKASKSKFMGGMIGSALGDAIGELAFTYNTDKAVQSALENSGQLRYTDDTAMVIGIAQSIITVNKIT